MPDVKIGTDDKHLLLTDPNPISGPPESLLAVLRLDGLAASAVVVHTYTSGFQDLADFFEQQARDWRGWAETREWTSVEGDLRIEARHEFGHVQLRVTVRRTPAEWGNQGWAATGDLTLDHGEQLTRIAQDVQSLAAG